MDTSVTAKCFHLKEVIYDIDSVFCCFCCYSVYNFHGQVIGILSEIKYQQRIKVVKRVTLRNSISDLCTLQQTRFYTSYFV